MSVRAPVGDVNIATQRCCIGRGIAAIRRGAKTDSEFLFYALMSHKENLDALGSGAIFKSINKDVLISYGINFPLLSEQRAIAAVLSKIQAAAETQGKIVATLKELKAATMAKLFREGLRKERLVESEIGRIPASWRLSNLGEIATIGNGSTPRRTNPGYWDGGTIPWLTSAKVHETIIIGADEFVTELAKKSCVSQHLAFLQFQSSDVIPEFVLRYLQHEYQHFRQAANAGGSTKGALTCSFLETFPIPLPDVQEQRQIAAILQVLDSVRSVGNAKRSSLNALFSSALNLLMTGQVWVDRPSFAEDIGRHRLGQTRG